MKGPLHDVTRLGERWFSTCQRTSCWWHKVLPLSCICRTPVAFVKATVNIALDLGMRICVSGDPRSRLCRSYGGAPFDHTTSSSACFDPWQSWQLACPDLSGGKKSRRCCSSQGTLMSPPIFVTRWLTVCIAWGAGVTKWLATLARTCSSWGQSEHSLGFCFGGATDRPRHVFECMLWSLAV